MKLIILDRDGVINQDSPDYIKSADEWHAIPGSLEAIARLNAAGYTVAVASNQSGVGRGLFTWETLQRIHEKMQRELAALQGHIDYIAVCPHRPEDDCACRKPKTGLLEQIAQYYHCSLTNVPIVGDSYRDIQASLAVQGQAILVLTGNGMTAKQHVLPEQAINIYPDLAHVVDALIESAKS